MENDNLTLTSTPVDRSSHQKHLWFILVVLLVLVAGCGVVYYFYYYQTPPASTKSVPSAKVEIDNPINFFYQRFSTKDYRISIVNKTSSRNNYFYYQKGVLVKIDTQDQYNNTSIILKDGKAYTIDHRQKTFVEQAANDPQVGYVLTIYKLLSVIDPILQSENPSAIPWTKLPPDSTQGNLVGFEALGRSLGPVYTGAIHSIDIRVFVDPATGLIPVAQMKESGKQLEWGKEMVEFQYEDIGDIELLKRFPMDYKKVDPI